ncbi:uncharacterized protein LOC131675094 [Phymastichus coffea]|uniref:uncharacterized protein LOC131675094 n=1 Tax=Phymastichus coffea TaxID=108790 RepID=UPI00273AF7AE|nr:uncharacterized protein LOC131675094 [Phymastichus coffea]
MQELSLIDEFENVIQGFSDTLLLFKDKFPKRESGYKLTTLAKELLALPCNGAHDASVDVILLEQLTTSFISVLDLIESNKTIKDISERMQKEKDAKEIIPSFKPMDDVISKAMQKRLAYAGITYENLVIHFKTKGFDDTKALLVGEVDGKPQIIKNKKILNSILDYLNSVLQIKV